MSLKEKDLGELDGIIDIAKHIKKHKSGFYEMSDYSGDIERVYALEIYDLDGDGNLGIERFMLQYEFLAERTRIWAQARIYADYRKRTNKYQVNLIFIDRYYRRYQEKASKYEINRGAAKSFIITSMEEVARTTAKRVKATEKA